jgi:hypothetical protein
MISLTNSQQYDNSSQPSTFTFTPSYAELLAFNVASLIGP